MSERFWSGFKLVALLVVIIYFITHQTGCIIFQETIRQLEQYPKPPTTRSIA